MTSQPRGSPCPGPANSQKRCLSPVPPAAHTSSAPAAARRHKFLHCPDTKPQVLRDPRALSPTKQTLGQPQYLPEREQTPPACKQTTLDPIHKPTAPRTSGVADPNALWGSFIKTHRFHQPQQQQRRLMEDPPQPKGLPVLPASPRLPDPQTRTAAPPHGPTPAGDCPGTALVAHGTLPPFHLDSGYRLKINFSLLQARSQRRHI